MKVEENGDNEDSDDDSDDENDEIDFAAESNVVGGGNDQEENLRVLQYPAGHLN